MRTGFHCQLISSLVRWNDGDSDRDTAERWLLMMGLEGREKVSGMRDMAQRGFGDSVCNVRRSMADYGGVILCVYCPIT